jgi:hypothetical protein
VDEDVEEFFEFLAGDGGCGVGVGGGHGREEFSPIGVRATSVKNGEVRSENLELRRQKEAAKFLWMAARTDGADRTDDGNGSGRRLTLREKFRSGRSRTLQAGAG